MLQLGHWYGNVQLGKLHLPDAKLVLQLEC